MPGKKSGFRPDIEGLRGIAVLAVVGFHCGVSGFAGGFVGVDVFFVLSGYLITGLLLKEFQSTGRISLWQFYSRRVRRLLPASALTLIVTLLVGAALMAPRELDFAGRAGRATSLYLSNVFFGVNAADYFAPDVETNPMLHTWSLAVEEQFYLVWPILIIASLVRANSRRSLIATLSALTAVSLAASVWFTARGGTFAFYELPARAWEFGIGGLAALLPLGAVRINSRWWLLLGYCGLASILLSAMWLKATHFPGWIALFPVVGTVAALICGSEAPHRGIGYLLDSQPLQFLGQLSYSWYLWHWPFLVFSVALFPGISVKGKVVAAVSSLLLAVVTHRLVENPIRFHPFLVARPKACLGLAVGLSLFTFLAATASIKYAVHLSKSAPMAAINAAVQDVSTIPRDRCVTLEDSTTVQTCTFGKNSSAPRVVLFGDSHAIQWFDPLLAMADAGDFQLITVLKSGCPAVDIRPPAEPNSFVESCVRWRADALRQIAAMRPPLVFTVSAIKYLRPRIGAGKGLTIDDWQQATRRTFVALASQQVQVVEMRDNPNATFDIPTCLARSARHAWYPRGACEVIRSEALDPAIFEAEKEAGNGIPNVHFIDLSDRFCGAVICPVVERGEVLYRDSDHLTARFASRLAPQLRQLLLPILRSANGNIDTVRLSQ